MILSIKLLVATLSISQFSGVVEARGNTREGREKLRNNLRKGSATTEAQTQRKTQFVWNDNNDDAPPKVSQFQSGMGFEQNQDDLFTVGEDIVDANVPAPMDDFFTYTEDGMKFDWDSAGHTHEEGDHDDQKDQDHVKDEPKEYYGGKTGKFSKALTPKASSSKVGKIGKVMWEETPVMVKSGKNKKSGKGTKKGKSDYYMPVDGREDTHHHHETPSSPSSPEIHHDEIQHSQEHFQPTDGDDWLSGFESSSELGYNDLFDHTTGAATPKNDDYFAVGTPAVRMSAGEAVAKKNNGDLQSSGELMGRSSMNTFDDDFFTTPDTRLVFLPRPTVTVAGSIFSQNSQVILAPIVPDGTGNSQSLGTEYLFNDLTFDAQNINSQFIPLQIDGTLVEFSVALDGICNRIGPSDQNSVQGYCFLTYTFLDPMTQLVAGAFTAQGIIVNTSVPGQLTIVGGTGAMTGATGVVEILPAAVDITINPPMLVQPDETEDPFNGVAGWAHFFEFDVDVLFFLPDLYQ